jgi:Fe-S cluster assembly protein SufD
VPTTTDFNALVHIIRRGSADADASINWALGLMNEGSQIIDNTTNLNGDRSTSALKSVVVGTAEPRRII